MKTQTMMVQEIRTSSYNPRVQLKAGDPMYEKIKRSIQEFGLVEPLVFNKASGRLVGGHQRLQVLKDLGATEVVVSVVNIKDPKRERALNVALNKISGDWDMPLLKDLLVDMDDGEFDLSLSGFDNLELKELVDYEGKKGLTDPDDVPSPPKKPIVKINERWILGDHQLFCGDSLTKQSIHCLLEGKKADMVFTDPPYNIDYGNIKHPKFKVRPIENDAMIPKEWLEFCAKIAAMIKDTTDGCVYVCHAPGPDGRVMAAMLDGALHSSTTVIWVKDSFTLGRGKYHNQYEPIWFGWSKGGGNFSERRDLANVWHIDRPKRSDEHPTMKPVDLVATAIDHATSRGQSVLDLFAGSGTTLMAAEVADRRAFLIEIEPRYCDVIIERWQNFTGKKAHRA